MRERASGGRRSPQRDQRGGGEVTLTGGKAARGNGANGGPPRDAHGRFRSASNAADGRTAGGGIVKSMVEAFKGEENHLIAPSKEGDTSMICEEEQPHLMETAKFPAAGTMDGEVTMGWNNEVDMQGLGGILNARFNVDGKVENPQQVAAFNRSINATRNVETNTCTAPVCGNDTMKTAASSAHEKVAVQPPFHSTEDPTAWRKPGVIAR